MPKVYLKCEDFVLSYVGPFDTPADALKHVADVVIPRGDDGTRELVTEHALPFDAHIVSPQQDAKLEVPK